MPVSMISAMQAHLGVRHQPPIETGGKHAVNRSLDQRSDAVDVTHNKAGWYERRQAREASHRAALHIRSLDARLQTITKQAREMANDIRAFEKNFPPFPRGSEERMRLLNSFSAIRKQIARLTIPREAAEKTIASERTAPPEPSGLLSTPSFEDLFAAIWEHVPAIPTDTTDTAFETLKQQLESLLDFIRKTQASFRHQIFSASGSTAESDKEASFEMADVSKTIGRLFSEQPEWHMIVTQVQLKVF